MRTTAPSRWRARAGRERRSGSSSRATATSTRRPIVRPRRRWRCTCFPPPENTFRPAGSYIQVSLPVEPRGTERARLATTTKTTGPRTRVQARGNPVWRKAPVSLLRHPTLFAALALGAFLVVISTAAYPLFLSASGSALVNSEIDNPTVTRFGGGITYTVTNVRLAEPSPDGEGLLIDRRR